MTSNATYSVECTAKQLLIDCSSIALAKTLRQDAGEILSIWLRYANVEKIKIAFYVQGKAFYPPIYISELLKMSRSAFLQTLDLVRSSEMEVCLTNHATHAFILMNDRFTPDRLVWQPGEFMGFNSLPLWKDSMESLEILERELRQNGQFENFTFRLRRVDRRIAEYTKDFLLIPDFLGIPVRLSFSREWRLLSDY